MIDVTFVPGITPITATWLNEANDTLVAIGTQSGASIMGCTPTGTVSATTVQGAIAQLASAVTYTDAQTRATVLTGLTTSIATVTATDTVLSAIGKLQGTMTSVIDGAVMQSPGSMTIKNATGGTTSLMTNANSLARTYALPDKNGTVAMLDDILVSDGAMVLVDQTTISTAVASVEFLLTFTSTYDTYVVLFDRVCVATASAVVNLQLAVGGVAITTGTYTPALTGTGAAPANTQIALSNALVASGSGGYGTTGEVFIQNVNHATATKSVRVRSDSMMGASPTFGMLNNIYILNAANVVTGFRILPSTGNLSSGTIRIYGIKKS